MLMNLGVRENVPKLLSERDSALTEVELLAMELKQIQPRLNELAELEEDFNKYKADRLSLMRQRQRVKVKVMLKK